MKISAAVDTSGLIQWASTYIEDDLSARMAVRMVVSCAAFLLACTRDVGIPVFDFAG